MRSVGARFLLPFGVLAVLFSAFLLHRTYSASQHHATELLLRQADLALQFNLAIRDYAAREIRPVMERMVGREDFIPETMSTSFISRSIFEEVRKKFTNCVIRFASDNPRNPINKASPDELRMIEYFRQNPEVDRRTAEVEIEGRQYLAHFVPKRVKPDCLRCHGEPKDAPAALLTRYGATASFHRPLGDVAGLDTVAIPVETVDTALASEMRFQSLILAGGLVLLFGSVLVVFRLVVVRRLADMARHFREIASEPESARMKPVEVGGQDEIGVLGAAFNTLLAQLKAAHASLEERVSVRTGELARANEDLKREVLDRQRAEEALRASEERYRLLVENSHELVVEVDRDLRILYASPNHPATTGYDPAALIGAKFTDWMHPDDLPPLLPQLQATDARITARYAHVDGSWRWLDSRGRWFRTSAGEVRGVFFSHDITERKEAEREKAEMEVQLHQAQKLESIGRLAAGIAHEINTPTQFIGDNIRFLQEAFVDLGRLLADYERLGKAVEKEFATSDLNDRVARLAEEIDVPYLVAEIPKAIHQALDGVGRVAKIVRAMREFSHPGSSDKAPVNLNQAIESTVTVARNEWRYVADLVLDLEPSLSPVLCFPGEFNQVIMNLVINAAHTIADVVGDGSKGKGIITIRTRSDGDWVEIRIQDTGKGIPKGIRHRVFEPFFTTKPVGQGTGQGLAMARSVIVEKHGGTITFETEEEHGTTFIIRLPIKPLPATHEAKAA